MIKKKDRIIILHNIQNLNFPDYNVILELVKQLAGLTGIVLTISVTRFEELQRKSEKFSYIRDLLTEVNPWIQVPAPEPNELRDLCLQRGILGKRIIDRLINKAPDFKLLNLEIDKVRDLLKDKGYLPHEYL